MGVAAFCAGYAAIVVVLGLKLVAMATQLDRIEAAVVAAKGVETRGVAVRRGGSWSLKA